MQVLPNKSKLHNWKTRLKSFVYFLWKQYFCWQPCLVVPCHSKDMCRFCLYLFFCLWPGYPRKVMLPSYQLSCGETFCLGIKSGTCLWRNTIQNQTSTSFNAPVLDQRKTLDNRTPSGANCQRKQIGSLKRGFCASQFPRRPFDFAGPPSPGRFTSKRKEVPKNAKFINVDLWQ